MKKWLAVVGLLLVPALFMSKDARADGNFIPVLVVSSITNQGYLYSNQPSSSQTGGLLVNNGGGIFNWSNAVVGTTTTATVTQFPALPSLTLAQLQALTPSTTGQIVSCSNCVRSEVCVSSGTTQNAWTVFAETGTMTSSTLTACK